MPIKFKHVKAKIYFIERTKEEISEVAIAYEYARKSKKWAEDFDGMVNEKYNACADKSSFSANKLLVKLYFEEDQIDLDLVINELKAGRCNYRSSVEYVLNKKYENYKEIDNEILKSHFEIVVPAKPKTWPKYNNETPFKCFTYNSPEIICIYWNGFDWMYQMKNVGHVYDFYSEEKINEFNKL